MTRSITRLFLRLLLPSGLALWLIAPCLSPIQGGEELTEAAFHKLHQQLQPPRGELWRTIPWQLSLLDACEQAAKEKKPLVVRVRAGHPLGCV
jgi:hypothetical protein